MFSQTVIILLIIFVIALAGKNSAVATATGALLVFKFFQMDRLVFPYLDKNGIKIGIIILTAGLLIPIANGRIGFKEIMSTLTDFKAVLAVLVGILIAYLAGRGVEFLSFEPQILTGIIIGSIIGVAAFKGVTVGPLVGAGILVILMKLFHL